MNFAIQLGARKLLLVGFDMKGGRRESYEAGVAKLDPRRIEEWRVALDGAAEQIASLGVEVINCSPGSALTCFPMASLAGLPEIVTVKGVMILANQPYGDQAPTGQWS